MNNTSVVSMNNTSVVGMNDTHPSIARKQLEILRAKTPEQRMQLAIAQSVYLINLSRAELEQKMSKEEAKIEWVRVNYGKTLAMHYSQALAAKEQKHEYQ